MKRKRKKKLGTPGERKRIVASGIQRISDASGATRRSCRHRSSLVGGGKGVHAIHVMPQRQLLLIQLLLIPKKGGDLDSSFYL